MLRKIAVVGATAAAIVGVGTAAMAVSGSTSGTPSSSSGSTSSTAKTAHKGKHRGLESLRDAAHAQITTKGKDGFVTRTAIRGTVTSVSATSLTVKAADGYTQTYTLTKDTKVRERPADGAKGKATAGTLAQVKSGDKVGVLGRSSEKTSASAGTPTATVIVDGLKK